MSTYKIINQNELDLCFKCKDHRKYDERCEGGYCIKFDKCFAPFEAISVKECCIPKMD